MKIIVCIKQVPATMKVEVDAESGTLKRIGQNAKTNPYDLYAIEAALRIREQVGGSVTALTMGPQQTEEMMRDAYMMGVDEAVVMSDPKFAGSDVLATSFTLFQGIRLLGGADLIICGKQTTDGDTAQIGPAIAEHMGIPHVAWVSNIERVTTDLISVIQKTGSFIQESEMKFPCLITVDKDIFVPRLPSYRLGLATANKNIRFISFKDLSDKNMTRYGLIGSPTKVEKMFQPESSDGQEYINGTSIEKADSIFELLKNQKII
ncbi:electron transfer flavoprotein subunit beta [Alkalibaculum sp. M08DMB]|uniref:Electron transfer flavoprotein small subunit n=1 Tax=Alkalibaculum sporogenes TaxID=2655001 RepID=A0A6A7K891_9FIRM|nr:electron transfer flavoprotein subunit beta/FixA family protein [Alkalibaculum sporogenes]MPW25592.1 electron transfer flavoprotein subunit beta [Alkalibaculum sporogenes]